MPVAHKHVLARLPYMGIDHEAADKPVCAENAKPYRVHENPGNKIRDSRKGLDDSANPHVSDFRKEHGESKRAPARKDSKAAHRERVFHDADYVSDGGGILEKEREPVKADEFIGCELFAHHEIIKSVAPAKKGQIGKKEKRG